MNFIVVLCFHEKFSCHLFPPIFVIAIINLFSYPFMQIDCEGDPGNGRVMGNYLIFITIHFITIDYIASLIIMSIRNRKYRQLISYHLDWIVCLLFQFISIVYLNDMIWYHYLYYLLQINLSILMFLSIQVCASFHLHRDKMYWFNEYNFSTLQRADIHWILF